MTKNAKFCFPRLANLAKLSQTKQKEELSKEYDLLYQRALALISKNNFCQSKCGSCIAARLNYTQKKVSSFVEGKNPRAFNNCCGGCEHLGPNGCTVEALTCRVWLCNEAYNKTLLNKTKILEIVQLNNLQEEIQEWGFMVFRGTKEDSLKQAMNLLR